MGRLISKLGVVLGFIKGWTIKTPCWCAFSPLR